MSSKIIAADNNSEVGPVLWRRVLSADPARPASSETPQDETRRLAQIEQQAEQRAREAYATGLREGETAARTRSAAEIQQVIERLARAVDEIAGLRPRLRAEAEADLIRLALAIARRVLRRELAIDPEALHGLVLGALEKLQGQELARVRVHPSHASLVSACLREKRDGAAVEVVPDPTREIGDVVFETQRGNLDASVESQLQEIERGLADRLRKQP
uniref:Flagellar assembly protein FliH n=1 Tax=Solibacter usitatus (strain Ellin6076) TaxID=234267 RepID=Q02C62_SOLUE